MQIQVHMSSSQERAVLLQMLNIWRGLLCVSVHLADWTPGEDTEPYILFWDLDSGALPSLSKSCKLILCSSCSHTAIPSYAVHPVGFLQKPIQMRELIAVLVRCRNFWWGSLNRIEIFSDRCRLHFPISSLIWAEGERRGCLLHGFQVSLLSRESLTALSQRLPPELFFRCHRSFLVNLCHIRSVDAEGIHMADGAAIPLSRAHLRIAQSTYNQFRQWRDGGILTSPQKEGAL